MKSKIVQELPILVDEGIISTETASKIQHYYNSKQASGPNNVLTIFGVLGSVLSGLGIILILAHNWDNFPKIIKTSLAFVPLLIGQIIVFYAILKMKSNTWLESSGVFLFFAVGASIALIAQIYNIPSRGGTFYISWLLLTLPLVYLLRSSSVFILCLGLSTFYVFEVGYGYFKYTQKPWMYFVFIAALLPYYVKILKINTSSNIVAVLNWLIPLSIFCSFSAFIVSFNQFDIIQYLLLFGLFYNFGKTSMFKGLKKSSNGFLIIGSLGLVIVLLVLSFNFSWDNKEFLSSKTEGLQDVFMSIVLVGTTSILIALKMFKSKFNWYNLMEIASIVALIIYFSSFKNSIFSTVLINILIFLLGISTILKGIHKTSFSILNFGLLILASLIICRFFDTNITFVWRGIIFVSLGIGFFVANYLMLERTKKNN